MKKILVPLDFSACSDNALQNAMFIADRMNMELILLHSFLIPVAMVEHAPGYLTQEVEFSEKTAHDQFDHMVERFPGLKKVPYKKFIEAGPLLDAVRSIAKNEDLAMVVMGTHGASGLNRVLLGSNAYNVMKNVECPVIALPEDADIKKLKRIGLAGDYKDALNPDCLQPVIDLATALFAEVAVIHIDRDKNLDSHEMELAKRLGGYLKHVSHSFHFRTDQDVEEGLIAFAKEEKIGLVAMINKRHSFLDWLAHGSETRRMMLDIPMPLMVLHE